MTSIPLYLYTTFCLSIHLLMDIWIVSIFQFSSVSQSCLTLCDPMDCSTPGLSVHHQLPESTQTHLHWVGDAIQPSYPLLLLFLSPSIFPSIRVFSNESDLHIRWPQYWSFSFNISRLLWIMLLWTLVYKYLFESVFSSLGYLPRSGIRGITWSISLVHSFSCVWSLVTPWTAARQVSLSITNSWGLVKLMSKSVILCHPLLLLPSIFPSIKIFSNFLRNCHSIFHSSCTILCFTLKSWGFWFLYILTNIVSHCGFEFAFLQWLVMLKASSYAYWSPVYLLYKNVYSDSLLLSSCIWFANMFSC